MKTASHATGAWTARSATLAVHQEEVHYTFHPFCCMCFASGRYCFPCPNGGKGGGLGGWVKKTCHYNRKSRLWKQTAFWKKIRGNTQRRSFSLTQTHTHLQRDSKETPQKVNKKGKNTLTLHPPNKANKKPPQKTKPNSHSRQKQTVFVWQRRTNEGLIC